MNPLRAIRVLTATTAAIACTTAHASDGAIPIYTAVNPTTSQELGNTASLLFQDGLRFVARLETRSQGSYRTIIDVVFSNPILAFGNYRQMNINFYGLTDLPTSVTTFAKNRNGMMDTIFTISMNSDEHNRGIISLHPMRYILGGGDIFLRLVCTCPQKSRIRLDRLTISFL